MAAPNSSPRASRRRAGFTLVEIVVALAILFTVVTFFLVALRGRETESRKSSNYLNAVMLAQKIADDLDHRARENPHAIERLAALGAGGRAVDGESPLFRYLEDTTGDGLLSNDAPIGKPAGSLYDQFKDFTFRVDLERGVRNGLARARISVRWVDRGRPQEYEIAQILPDLPGRVETGSPADYDTPVDDEAVREALFNEPGPLDSLLERYRIERAVAVDLAKTRIVCRAAAEKLADADARDVTLERSSAGATASGVAERARLREENAVLIAQTYRALAVPLGNLDSRIASGTLDFGTLFSNSCAVGLAKDLLVAAREVGGRANPDCLAFRFNAEIAASIGHRLRLAADPAVAANLSWRARTGSLMRIVELGSVLVQNHGDRLVLSAGTARIQASKIVENAFKLLAGLLAGRDYNKADYLEEKLRSIKNRRFAEYEDVSDRVKLMTGGSAAASRLLARVIAP